MKKKFIFVLLFLVLLFPIKIKALDNISIIYYKNIGDCDRDTCIDYDLFNLQMMELKSQGYHTISLDEFMDWRDGKAKIEDKSVLLLLQYNYERETIDQYLNLYGFKIYTFEDYLPSFKGLLKQATKNDDINNIPVYLAKNTLDVNEFTKYIEGTNEVKEFDMSETATEIPVLNYHFLYETYSDCGEGICFDVKEFEKELDYLNKNGYKTLTMDEFVKWKYGEIELPKKSVLITFDDGGFGTSDLTRNYLINALEKYDAHATLFLITGFWNMENYISPYLDVQTHTHDLHKTGSCGTYAMACVTEEEILNDFKTSLKSIKDTKSFAYPFYYYNDHVINVLKELDIKVAFVGGQYKAKRNCNNYLIPRFVIMNGLTLEEFKEYLN